MRHWKKTKQVPHNVQVYNYCYLNRFHLDLFFAPLNDLASCFSIWDLQNDLYNEGEEACNIALRDFLLSEPTSEFVTVALTE